MLYVYGKTCSHCNGMGLFKSKEFQLCNNCKNNNAQICFMCENSGGPKKVHECERCSGYGEVFYDASNHKQVFLFALTSYKFIR